MMRRNVAIVLGFVALIGAFFVIHTLNDFARTQNVEIDHTPMMRGALSRVIVRNKSSDSVGFELRCNYGNRRGREVFSRFLVVQPYESVEFDPNPELAAGELPRIIPGKYCGATWHGPLGITCHAWGMEWSYNKRSRKGASLADEEGACRIATCYATSRLLMIPQCLWVVYGPRRER